MEKLVFIKHKPSATIDEICAKIIETINLLSAQQSLIIFDLTINKNETDFSSWIAKNEELQEIEVLSQQEFFRTCNYFLRIPIEKIEGIIRQIEEREICVAIYCDKAKLILNDNDGDYIIYDKIFKR